MNPYNNIYIDISGVCNAKCPWCERGARKRGLLPPLTSSEHAVFMEPSHFASILDHLLNKNIIQNDAIINLHNWGEPLLNPHFLDIISELNKRDMPFSLSTNASKVIKFKANSFSKACDILFSMPGFSQSSYDRAHGFNFKAIAENIKSLLHNLEGAGFKNKVTLVYHLYKFNSKEVIQAIKFATHLQMSFVPVPAMFNAFDMYFDYMSGKLSETIMNKAQQDLFLLPKEKILQLRPDDYICPSKGKTLAISANGQLNSGCCARINDPREYAMGNILDMDLSSIHKLLDDHPTCKKCQALGADFICQSPLYQNEILQQKD